MPLWPVAELWQMSLSQRQPHRSGVREKCSQAHDVLDLSGSTALSGKCPEPISLHAAVIRKICSQVVGSKAWQLPTCCFTGTASPAALCQTAAAGRRRAALLHACPAAEASANSASLGCLWHDGVRIIHHGGCSAASPQRPWRQPSGGIIRREAPARNRDQHSASTPEL